MLNQLRNQKLTKEQKSDISRRAALARWRKSVPSGTTEPASSTESTNQQQSSP